MFRHTTFRSFMDLQEENDGVTPGAGWYKNEFLKWTKSTICSGIEIVLELSLLGLQLELERYFWKKLETKF